MAGNKLLVAGIDFGTTFSGYAFSFRDQYKQDPININVNQNWVAGSMALVSMKAPTCLLLDKKQQLVAFGYDAEDKYSNLALDNEHHDYYYFRRFKMVLHNNKTLSRSTTIEDDKGQSMLAITVFALAIGHLKKHLLDTLEQRGTGVGNSDVMWVLTVPAIWSDNAKQFMREAAKEAGIEQDQLRIALEPEAASLYCQHIPTERLVGSSGTKFGVSSAGTKYMVLDLGGGTADITVHQKQADGTLKEIHKASGGDWGGTKVDSEFEMMLIKLVSGKIMKDFSQKHKSDYLDLQRELETKKRTIKTDSTEKVTIKIPVMLITLFEKTTGEEIKDVIEQSRYAKKVTWVGDKMRMQASVFLELFNNCKNSIVAHINDIMMDPQVKDVPTILMVGGFSECQPIQDAIRKAFPNKRIIIPSEAGLAVLKGAVIFGYRPEQISSRISKFTYGINISPPFQEGIHMESKKVTVDGSMRCRDIFKKYVIVGQSLKIGEAVKGRHTTIKKKQESMILKVFGSPQKNPAYVTDEGCQYLGRIIVTLPGTEDKQSVEVKMMFGETELVVTANEEKTGKTFESKFDFL